MSTGEAKRSSRNPKGAAPGSLLRQLVRNVIQHPEQRRCLLAVCPNSEAVARAAMEAAREADAPLIYAATLNQIDTDGGYTGRTPQTFADFVHTYAREIDFEGPVAICLDHGGPWLKDSHVMEELSIDQSMQRVKHSFEACIDAGYAMLHVDPTVDRSLPPRTPIPIELVVDRTIKLIAHAEEYRARTGAPSICYEVGTEEVHGGLADLDVFNSFLTLLDRRLKEHSLEHAWPCFVVGKVGTDLDTDLFDPHVARQLNDLVRPYGAAIKGHYTDYVKNPEDYPLSGMGGANVGPEFTEEEHAALEELIELETKIERRSGLAGVLRQAVVDSGRWKKWLHEDEEGTAFEDLSNSRQKWLVRTGSRYIWTKPAVVEARDRLYRNLKGVRDADAFVRWRIRTSILKYYHAFNLVGFDESR